MTGTTTIFATQGAGVATVATANLSVHTITIAVAVVCAAVVIAVPAVVPLCTGAPVVVIVALYFGKRAHTSVKRTTVTAIHVFKGLYNGTISAAEAVVAKTCPSGQAYTVATTDAAAATTDAAAAACIQRV